MGKRSELSVAQRREAVLALLRREEPATKLARRFGVSEQTLHRWRDEFLAAVAFEQPPRLCNELSLGSVMSTQFNVSKPLTESCSSKFR